MIYEVIKTTKALVEASTEDNAIEVFNRGLVTTTDTVIAKPFTDGWRVVDGRFKLDEITEYLDENLGLVLPTEDDIPMLRVLLNDLHVGRVALKFNVDSLFIPIYNVGMDSKDIEASSYNKFILVVKDYNVQ
jgi:hypothetical protein